MRDGGSTHLEEEFYGSRRDSLVDGLNTEITTKLTIARRPGLSVYNSATWSSPIAFYEFRLFNQNTEQIKVMVDTATALYDGTGPSTQDLVWTKTVGAGQTYMQSVGNSLYFGNGIDKKKWLNTLLTWQPNTSYSLVPYDLNTFILDPNGNIEQLINTIFTVSDVNVTSNVLTITSPNNLLNTIQIGENIVFAGLTGATFLNNLNPAVTPITVLTVGTNTFTANFTNPNYSGTESGTDQATVLVGGTPVSGGTMPIWNATLNGTTNDGTAQWRNKGSELENWGIAAPTTEVDLDVSGSASSWQPNTFYSNSLVIIDSNGNLQKITTAGKSGATAPTWAVSVGGTTTDGTVLWTMIQTAASLVWMAGTAYTPGQFLVASGGGTPCLFQLQPFSGVQMSSNLDVWLWNTPHSGAVASVTNTYPTSTGSALANSLGTLNSLLLTGTPLGTGADLAWVTLNNAGQSTGTTNPFPSFTSNYQLSINTSLVIPAAGNYTFTIKHEDGWYWGFGAGTLNVTITEVAIASSILTITCNENVASTLAVGISGTFSGLTTATFLNGQTVTITSVVGNQFTAAFSHANYGPASDTGTFSVTTGNTPTLISGPNVNNIGQTQTFVNGYTRISGYNGVAPGGTQYTDVVTINFPVAGTYPVEIDYAYWYHSGQIFEMTVNGNNILPSGSPTSGATQPVWPAWTTTLAPAYPSVSESSGELTWDNLGPASDYTWHALTNFTTTPDIVDSNSNIENPYRAGVSGTTVPVWATTLNALTLDNPYLTWINQGPASAGPAGTVTTVNGGWSYVIALVNTLDNTVSDAGPVSPYTGNFHAGTGVLVTGGLPAVIDPQVDYVAIFRTQDGGATYYLIPGDGNTEYTISLPDYEANGYLDTTQDTALNTLLEAPLDDQNALPPDGIINLTYHLSCIFGSVGNTVYWSTGPDTPVGNGINGFSPNNYSTFPSLVKCLVPLSYGILVFTVSDIYLLSGSNTAADPITPVPYLTDVGLLSYNALTVNGSVIYFYTSDGQLVSLEPSSGLAEISFPIGDQIEVGAGTFNPSTAYVTWHVSGTRDKAIVLADGVGNWFRMIPTPSPESGLTWCPKATISGGCKAVQSIETTPGTHNLLVGPSTSGPILYRDYNNYTDNGTTYPAFFTFGSIVLAQPGQRAELDFFTTDSLKIGHPLNISILLDEISGNFDNMYEWVTDPTELEPPQSMFAQRFYVSQTQNPAICRHFQAKVSWIAEDIANEILSFSIFGGFSVE